MVEQQRTVAEAYAFRLMTLRKLGAQQISRVEIEQVAYHVVRNYPDHGFVISRQAAREHDLPIKDLETSPQRAVVERYYEA